MKRLLALWVLLWVSPIAAGNGRPLDPGYERWKEECGSCHIAYPPHMLSEENWEALLARLDNHFNSNAMLSAEDNRLILSFLRRFAGSGPKYTSPSLRISETPWFRREHRVIAEREWKLPEVQSRSNCAACHGRSVLGE